MKILDNTWSIEDKGVRFFLLAGENKALLIDSGMQIHDAKEIAKSLEKLEFLKDRFDTIYSSHGTICVNPDLISKLHQSALSILAGKVEATNIQFHGMEIKEYDVGCAKFWC